VDWELRREPIEKLAVVKPRPRLLAVGKTRAKVFHFVGAHDAEVAKREIL
jgi:hypothetical protein